MRYSQRRTRNYIIMGLCMVLAVMAVSYAAFSQQLTINSSVGTTTKWCLGFDTTVTGNVSATAGLTGATAPTGTITYDGNTCDGNYNSGALLSSTLHQPGDTVTYTLTIKNASSLNAKIDSITVDDTNIVSNQTITKGNIKFIIEMPESTSLSANTSTTMKVTAKFQDDTDITGTYSGESNNVTVKINASQDDGTGGFEKKFSGTIYRHNSNSLAIGDSVKKEIVEGWVISNNGVQGPPDVYNSEDECMDDYTNKYHMSGSPFVCQLVPVEKGPGEYTTDASTLNKTYYLKHDIIDDIVTNSYVCFVYNNDEHCMKGGDGGVSFTKNEQTIKDYQTFYNLSDCYYASHAADCQGGEFIQIHTYDGGNAFVFGSLNKLCIVNEDGDSSCKEES